MRNMMGSMILALAVGGAGLGADAGAAPITLEAESARIDSARTEIVTQDSFESKRGVSLKAGVATQVGSPDTQPDLVFSVQAPQAGRYWIYTNSATDAKGTEAMRQAAGKSASLRLMISIDGSLPRRRVVFVPWSKPESCTQALGKYDFTGRKQEIRIWLPEGVRLDFLRIAPYIPPEVPAAAAGYKPSVVPPDSRPRLWVNADSLPLVRANLDKGENAPLWKQVQAKAAKPFVFEFNPKAEVGHNAALESAVIDKAFVCLMTGDQARGREAISLVRDYISAVEFDNLLDITREIGRTIYSASLVYDWCYDLMTPAERETIRKGLMRLADDMEIGWPPFRQLVVNGHGNEAQVNRDLLSMAIALYNEDPIPYRYCAYRILEELVPMRAFEYQSPRHNQGVSYGPYRFGWDMHAAWLFRRMTGKPVFDPNIGEVYKYWLYMRLPSGQTLRDGDGFSDGRPANLGATPLLCYAYTNNPVIKGDFERQGGLPGDPILVLLLNDPALKAEKRLDSLPQTLDFGPVLGAMIARTGWTLGQNLADVVVEMKGGGYNFGNHQHADAGSFQIYYRGLQAVDLGQYHFYGTPYDSNFCKRSVAHSMLFVVDPNETFTGTTSNDGGARAVRTCPATVEQTKKNPLFANGRGVSASFGPSPQRPFFSYFSVDLKSAYSAKIQDYVRSFCFLNLGNEQTPAVLIVLDAVTAAKPEFKKYWQVNALNAPEKTADGVILRNSDLGLAGKVNVHMLRPRPEERNLEILSGAAAHNVFGQQFTPPRPAGAEANGHRVLFSPKTPRAADVFLTVMPMSEDAAPELPMTVTETDAVFVLTLADRVVVLSKTGHLLDQPLDVDVPTDRPYQLLLAGLAPGAWSIRGADGKTNFNARVEAGRNTAFFVVPGGRFSVRPESIPGAPEFAAADLLPPVPSSLDNRIFLDGKMLPVPPARPMEKCALVPAMAVLKAAGVAATEAEGKLRVALGDRTAVFETDAPAFELDGCRLGMPAGAVREAGEWFLPDMVLAALLQRDFRRDRDSNSVELSPAKMPISPDVLWVESTDDSDMQGLRALLAEGPGRRAYWASRGDDVRFDVVLARPLRLKGVGIQWHLGGSRQSKFSLETSGDGATWKKVFDGVSSGTTDGLETYSFAPEAVRYVRFRGFGNTSNDWNSLIQFRLIRAE